MLAQVVNMQDQLSHLINILMEEIQRLKQENKMFTEMELLREIGTDREMDEQRAGCFMEKSLELLATYKSSFDSYYSSLITSHNSAINSLHLQLKQQNQSLQSLKKLIHNLSHQLQSKNQFIMKLNSQLGALQLKEQKGEKKEGEKDRVGELEVEVNKYRGLYENNGEVLQRKEKALKEKEEELESCIEQFRDANQAHRKIIQSYQHQRTIATQSHQTALLNQHLAFNHTLSLTHISNTKALSQVKAQYQHKFLDMEERYDRFRVNVENGKCVEQFQSMKGIRKEIEGNIVEMKGLEGRKEELEKENQRLNTKIQNLQAQLAKANTPKQPQTPSIQSLQLLLTKSQSSLIQSQQKHQAIISQLKQQVQNGRYQNQGNKVLMGKYQGDVERMQKQIRGLQEEGRKGRKKVEEQITKTKNEQLSKQKLKILVCSLISKIKVQFSQLLSYTSSNLSLFNQHIHSLLPELLSHVQFQLKYFVEEKKYMEKKLKNKESELMEIVVELEEEKIRKVKELPKREKIHHLEKQFQEKVKQNKAMDHCLCQALKQIQLTNHKLLVQQFNLTHSQQNSQPPSTPLPEPSSPIHQLTKPQQQNLSKLKQIIGQTYSLLDKFNSNKK